MTSLWNVDEDPRSIGFQLERFRMCSQFDIPHMFFARGVDHPNRSVSKSNVKPLFDGVISQVVGISLKINHARRTIGFGIEKPNSPIFATGDCNQYKIVK